MAIPAIRLSGVYLALATFGFGILLERMVYRTFLMFGSEGNRSPPVPGGVSDKAYFFVAVGVAVLAALLTRRIQRGRLGRLLEAVADSPKALTSLGASVTTALVLVFCASAFLAGAAGGTAGVGVRHGRLVGPRCLPVAAVADGHRHGRHPGRSARRSWPRSCWPCCPSTCPQSLNEWQPVAFGAAALLTSPCSPAGSTGRAGSATRSRPKADRTHRSPTLSRRGDLGWTAMARRP